MHCYFKEINHLLSDTVASWPLVSIIESTNPYRVSLKVPTSHASPFQYNFCHSTIPFSNNCFIPGLYWSTPFSWFLVFTNISILNTRVVSSRLYPCPNFNCNPGFFSSIKMDQMLLQSLDRG